MRATPITIGLLILGDTPIWCETEALRQNAAMLKICFFQPKIYQIQRILTVFNSW
jgi:hypothetical protein